MDPSPIPFSGAIPINNRVAKGPIPFSGMDDNNNPNPFYRHHYHRNNKINSHSQNRHRGNKFPNEETKEISSEALDGLFDFNIGKELDPEPEVCIEK